jgi:hypothetical protein
MNQNHLHPSVRIPDGPLRAVDGFAKMIAMGILEREDAIQSLTEAAVRLGCGMAPTELRTNFSIKLNGLIPIWEMRRSKTERMVRYQVKPIVQRWGSVAELEAGGVRINDEMGQPLLCVEIERIIAGLMAEHLMWQRRTGRGRV